MGTFRAKQRDPATHYDPGGGEKKREPAAFTLCGAPVDATTIETAMITRPSDIEI